MKYFLKGDNENQLRGKLNSAGMRINLPENAQGNPHYGPLFKDGVTYDLDWIGKVVDQPGEYDDEGNEITPPTFLPGVYCNIYTDAELPQNLENLRIYPDPPYRTI